MLLFNGMEEQNNMSSNYYGDRLLYILATNSLGFDPFKLTELAI
jgi:hypothetical protein